jgi:hypothetical protein
VVTVSDIVNSQGTVGHTETLGDFAIMIVIVIAIVYLMHKWNQDWRDPVKRQAMLTLNGLKHIGRR